MPKTLKQKIKALKLKDTKILSDVEHAEFIKDVRTSVSQSEPPDDSFWSNDDWNVDVEVGFPKRIITLDIETFGRIDPRTDAMPKVGVIGIKAFEFVNSRKGYIAKDYLCYNDQEIGHAEKVLKRTKCPILGYNLFNFDYRVLNSFFSVSDLIPRTVDLLWYFASRAKSCRRALQGYSLNAMSQLNLKKRKLTSSETVPELLAQGKIGLVKKHNERDLDLTFLLWHKYLARNWLIICPPLISYDRLPLLESDVPFLVGQQPMLTAEQWPAFVKARATGNFFKSRSDRDKGGIILVCDPEFEMTGVHREFGEIGNIEYKMYYLFCAVCGWNVTLLSLADRRDYLRSKVYLPCPLCHPELKSVYEEAGLTVGRRYSKGLKCPIRGGAADKKYLMHLVRRSLRELTT